MTAKEYLLQIKEQNNHIRKQQEYIQRLQDSLGIAGISYDNERVKTSPEPDSFAKIICQIAEEEQVLDEMKNRLAKIRIKIINEIHQLDNDKYQDILNYVYVDGKSLKKAASAMSFSYGYAKEIHTAALNEFEEKFLPQFT